MPSDEHCIAKEMNEVTLWPTQTTVKTRNESNDQLLLPVELSAKQFQPDCR